MTNAKLTQNTFYLLNKFPAAHYVMKYTFTSLDSFEIHISSPIMSFHLILYPFRYFFFTMLKKYLLIN